MKNQTSQYWFQTRIFRIMLMVAAVVAVVLIVMFSEQIGDLLKQGPSKAGTTIELNSSNLPLGSTEGDLVIVEPSGNTPIRLELAP